MFYMLLGYFALAVLHLLLSLVAKMIQKLHRPSSKIGTLLYWNSFIRFYMEVYLDFAICALLNLKTMYWDEKLSAVSFSNVFAITTIAFSGIIPAFLVGFYIRRLKMWDNEIFQAKYSSMIDGTNQRFKTRQWIVLCISAVHFIRRLIFALTIVFWFDFFWG